MEKHFSPCTEKQKQYPRGLVQEPHSPLSSLFSLQTVSSLFQHPAVYGNARCCFCEGRSALSSALADAARVPHCSHFSLKEIPLGAESIAALITPSTEPIVWHWPRIKGTWSGSIFHCNYPFCISVSSSSVVNILYFFIDWVNVANDLLRSCHVNQHIKHLSECGADVFVCLYESILGEKVPGGNVNS